MPRQPSQSEAYATGAQLARRVLRDADVTTLRETRRVWLAALVASPLDHPVRWGHEGMVAALGQMLEQQS